MTGCGPQWSVACIPTPGTCPARKRVLSSVDVPVKPAPSPSHEMDLSARQMDFKRLGARLDASQVLRWPALTFPIRTTFFMAFILALPTEAIHSTRAVGLDKGPDQWSPQLSNTSFTMLTRTSFAYYEQEGPNMLKSGIGVGSLHLITTYAVLMQYATHAGHRDFKTC